MAIQGVVNGMTVVVDQATVDSAQVHAYLKLHVVDPTSNVTFYSREVEYDRNIAGGETFPQFAARVIAAEKASRDAAILSHLSKSSGSTDVTASLTALTQP